MMVGRVGPDFFGYRALAALRENGVNVDNVSKARNLLRGIMLKALQSLRELQCVSRALRAVVHVAHQFT